MSPAGRPPRDWRDRAAAALRRLAGAPTQSESIRKNLEALLATAPGERRGRPDFGCGIESLLFEPIGPALLDEVRRRISNAIWRHERRIELLEVRAGVWDPETLLIEIDYRIRSSGERCSLAVPLAMAGQGSPIP